MLDATRLFAFFQRFERLVAGLHPPARKVARESRPACRPRGPPHPPRPDEVGLPRAAPGQRRELLFHHRPQPAGRVVLPRALDRSAAHARAAVRDARCLEKSLGQLTDVSTAAPAASMLWRALRARRQQVGADLGHGAHAAKLHRALELAREDLERAPRTWLAAGHRAK